MPRAAGVRGRYGPRASLRATFLAVALTVTVPFLCLVGYLVNGEIARERRHAEGEARGRAEALAAQIAPHLTARLSAIMEAAATVATSGRSPVVIDAQARRLRQSFPDMERVVVADELGVVLGASPQGEGRRAVGDQEWFKRAATLTEPFVGEPWQVGPDVMVGVYAPARAPEGQLRGVIAADLSLRPVQALLVEARLGIGGVAELLSGGGLVLARQPALFLMRSLREVTGYADLVRRGGGTGELTFEDGEPRVMGAVAVRPTGWVVAVGLPPGDTLAPMRARLGWAILAAAVIAMLGVGAALAIAGREVRGMRRLRLAMSRLRSGDIPASIPVTVGGDVGDLTEGFNRTLAWLHAKLRDVEAMTRVEEAAGAAIASDRSVSGVLPGLLRRVVAGMGADVGLLLIEDEEGLGARALVGLPGARPEEIRLRPREGLAGAVMTERQVIAIPDTSEDYRADEPHLKAAELRSAVAAPILSADDVVGVVEIGYRLPHTFPETEIQRLETMVRRLGQALGHARALETVRRNTEGLEAQLAEQLEALQRAAMEQAEARRQAQEARRQAQELEQRMSAQAAQPAQVREVIVEKEVVRYQPSGEEAARFRAEMQKTVSEELRAPLTALLDLPRFLMEGLDKPLGEDERQELEVLRDRGEEILELIDNLAILSGLHAGQVSVAKASFELPQLIQRVVRALQPRAAAKGNRIEADIKLGVGAIASDPKRVEQVLTNLLVTAIKYTEVGEIRVTCFARTAEVVLTIADDGAGFSPEEQTRIFEPFLQVGPRDGRALPGTGLALTVCKRLVDALGGRIKVESEVDRGTWFTVSLPVQG